jgi:hypothetical protein
MNLVNVYNELGTVIDQVPGLRVFPWATKTIEPPGCILTLPDRRQLETSRSGLEKLSDVIAVVLLDDSEPRMSLKRAAEFSDTSGTKSIMSKIHTYTAWTACDFATVTSIEFDQGAELAGVPYLGLLFHIDIFGTGQ